MNFFLSDNPPIKECGDKARFLISEPIKTADGCKLCRKTTTPNLNNFMHTLKRLSAPAVCVKIFEIAKTQPIRALLFNSIF